MGRRRLLLHDQDRPEVPKLARRALDTGREDVRPVAGELLRLQRTGGNEAVGSLLARRESPLARDYDDAERKKPVSSTLLMPEPVNVLPVIAWNQGRNKDEMRVIVPSTEWDSLLFSWMAKGKPLGKVTISGRVTITIDEALLANCTQGDPLELTLNGAVTPG